MGRIQTTGIYSEHGGDGMHVSMRPIALSGLALLLFGALAVASAPGALAHDCTDTAEEKCGDCNQEPWWKSEPDHVHRNEDGEVYCKYKLDGCKGCPMPHPAAVDPTRPLPPIWVHRT